MRPGSVGPWRTLAHQDPRDGGWPGLREVEPVDAGVVGSEPVGEADVCDFDVAELLLARLDGRRGRVLRVFGDNLTGVKRCSVVSVGKAAEVDLVGLGCASPDGDHVERAASAPSYDLHVGDTACERRFCGWGEERR